MEQRSYPYSQGKNSAYYNGNNSRNQFKSNNKVINLVNIIYDNEFVAIINDLSSSLKNCFKLLNKLINNIKEISAALGNQIIYSKCLLNDYIIQNKKNKNEKLLQIKDRLDFIDNNKKLLESNISFMNVNIFGFIDNAKTLFKKMKTVRNSKLNNFRNNYNNIKRNYNSYDNKRNKNRKVDTFQSYNSLSCKKNKSFKNLSENLYINSSDDLNDKNYLENGKDYSERQKTISFNLRRFMFNKNKEKVNDLIDNISINKENKIKNNILFNYCSKAKNNRKKVNGGNIKSLKNINSFKNDNRINNFFSNSIYEKRNENNINNNKKKINFKYNSNNNNLVLNQDFDNKSDNLKMNIDSVLANNVIKYFTLLKNEEKNKMQIEKIQKNIMNMSLNIINNKKANQINSLKHNYIKNNRISENMMRNNNQIKINNSIGNNKNESNDNAISILNKELNKKNELIKKLKITMENRYKEYGIIKAQNFEIIQEKKMIIIIVKEINLNYLSKIKQNNINENNKNYKYKYELILEEINTKKNEIIELNNKIDELTKTNNSLLNKLDTINISKNNLEQEKENLLLKIKKLEDFSNGNKKIIITNSDEEIIEGFSDIIEEQSSENEKEKKLVKENNKLQEKINVLQSELNKKILNDNDKSRKLSRNTVNNEYENCVELDSVNIKKNGKNDLYNNINELKMKEDLIEKLQAELKEYKKNKNKNDLYFNKKDDYIILCERNFKEFKWFLITKKIFVNKLSYENMIWANKNQVSEELIKNNNFENSEEEKIIMNYLRKLEEKENLISKLELKIKYLEKNMNQVQNKKDNRSKSTNSNNFFKNDNKMNKDIDNSNFD